MFFSISDCILDLIQNSIEAEASEIDLILNQSVKNFTVSIKDNGCGMTSEELIMATDPFYTNGKKHIHRKVGLGIPFLMQTLSMTEGKSDINSIKDKGTTIDIEFNLSNIDTPPIGNLISLMYQVMCFDGCYSLNIERLLTGNRKTSSYSVKRHEMQNILGELNSVLSLSLLKDFITSQEEELKEEIYNA
jgi:Histidine kinase-, DNA gyrase B-, and HSP90-like ATPase